MKRIYDIGQLFFLSLFLMACSMQKKSTRQPDDFLGNLLADSSLQMAHAGVMVADAETSTVLHQHQAHKLFVPASNTKLWSLYAGLKYLGDSLVGLRYRETGDTLYALPAGDPTLLHTDYKNHPVYEFLKAQTRHVLISTATWKSRHLGNGWAWNDYNATYMAERSAMPVYGNVMKVRFEATKAGVATGKGDSMNLVLKTLPARLLPAEGNRFVHDSGISRPVLTRAQANNQFEIRYNQRANFFVGDVPVATHGIHTALQILGLQSVSETERPPGRYGKPFTTLYSQPTDSMLAPMMHRSDNFFAEQTLLMASNEYLGYMNERAMIDTMLKTTLVGLPDKPVWADGSGLSRYNLFSPADYVWLLRKMKTEFSWQRITAILPTGNEGTLAGLYKGLEGKIFGKTGTLQGVVALSGYLQAKSGRQLVFSVLVNNHNTSASAVRKAVERYLMQVYNAH
jgi:D-alanyl-D-alanine carboxypeptidase/D-alanyl-D-alanine-endopeptidase (penicillin-binding protein 4)